MRKKARELLEVRGFLFCHSGPQLFSPWGTQCDLPAMTVVHCSVTGQRRGEIVPAGDTGSSSPYTFI
jgi:hypothetical protein